jgi:hypothetical protein
MHIFVCVIYKNCGKVHRMKAVSGRSKSVCNFASLHSEHCFLQQQKIWLRAKDFVFI